MHRRVRLAAERRSGTRNGLLETTQHKTTLSRSLSPLAGEMTRRSATDDDTASSNHGLVVNSETGADTQSWVAERTSQARTARGLISQHASQ